MIRVNQQFTELSDWSAFVSERVKRKNLRYEHLTVRRTENGFRVLEALLLDRRTGAAEVITAPIADGCMEIPTLTEAIPAAHWAERLIGDLWGLQSVGHKQWKSLILNDAWQPEFYPCLQAVDGVPSARDSRFMTVGGDGVHEIPVGPIHAGIIEPGHFRFSCLGEVIANLEIRLGYLHRGIEDRMQQTPWRHARHIAEAAASDSAVAQALAHAMALENLWGLEVSPRAAALRTLSLEIERVAAHLGDLGALASDIGFAVGAANYGRLRGDALALGQKVGGSRFQRGFVCPGGVAWDITDKQLRAMEEILALLIPDADEASKLLFQNPGVQERMEGVGVLAPGLADEFGMVGPAARASNSNYDARKVFSNTDFEVAREAGGDVWARANIRRNEILTSFTLIRQVMENLPSGATLVCVPDRLPADKVGLGIVESWRGELIHWVTTDSQGEFARYSIREPSFQNWTGLAIAVRGNLVADFPLINKSFNLSYSGNDL